jgi:putative lipoic acid-binding regulatory protein
MASGGSNGSSNGQRRSAAVRAYLSDADDRLLLDSIASAHQFPGYYPIVVIARREAAFQARLHAAVTSDQDGAPFRIRERPSRQGNYIAYRVEVYVDSPEIALARKSALAALTGVLFLL